MKTIGLIGGMSWQSSDTYYQIINRKVKETLGGVHSCRSLMYSVDFAEIAELQHKGDWEALGVILVDAVRKLERGGADFLVLCTNTLHKLAKEIEQNTPLPFLHIADATAHEIHRQGHTTVGLLGTRFTMEQDFLRRRFLEHHHISTIIPSERARERIHAIIFEELVKGILKESSRQEYLQITEEVLHQGAQGIILGCTEIGLLIRPQDTAAILYDSAQLHAERAVEVALS
ncbi:aspartate/glutamate racemase family protein [Rufibacter ruber]|uniref:aspartate/glutamate racemase family protein n=1 Tax=Rufibacter ruber TaxID=1783499 RepID=UPI000835535B|nr:aspartate/glutamate racemase family protein [Rufibacter ruber]